jgi:hypothetical protein
LKSSSGGVVRKGEGKDDCEPIPLRGRQFALKWEIPGEVQIDIDMAHMAYCWIELPDYGV